MCDFLSVSPEEESVIVVSVTAAGLSLLLLLLLLSVRVDGVVAVRICGGGYFLKKLRSRGGSCCASRICDSIAAAIVGGTKPMD